MALSALLDPLRLTVPCTQLGNFHGMAPFGVITECNSPDFNGVDGILGFGLPKPGYEGRTLPNPILFALTEKGIADSNAQVPPRPPDRPPPPQFPKATG